MTKNNNKKIKYQSSYIYTVTTLLISILVLGLIGHTNYKLAAYSVKEKPTQ